MKLIALLPFFFLAAAPALADDNTNNVIRVENGVTVTSGAANSGKATSTPPAASAAPAATSPAAPAPSASEIKNGNTANDFFAKPAMTSPVQTSPSATSASKTSANSLPANKPVGPEVKMSPIISPNSPGADGEKTKPVKKPAKEKTSPPVNKTGAEKATENTPQDSPFKKSQDAGAVETVKAPEPMPEVKAETLSGGKTDDGDIVNEIEHIDKMGNEKATPNDVPLSAIIGGEKTAAGPQDENAGGQNLNATGESGLPVPRFVSFKSGEVNARTGPGENYPIRWVYQRKNLPVEITAEFKLWRRIKDFDGEESWVHHAMVSSRRYAIISRDVTAKSDIDDGSKIANFKRGVQVKIDECKEAACEVQYGKLEGWVPKKNLWGVMVNEVFH